MLPEIAEVKLRRTRLGLTQSGLAFNSHVSQSLIAKIESGRTMPSYAIAKKIFETLEGLEQKTLKKAKDVLNRQITSLEESDLVEKALLLMKKKNISQLPVLRQDLPVGSISEKTLLDKVTSGITPEALPKMQVSEVMTESFPVVDEETPLPAVTSLLSYSFAVLVKRGQKVVGIITKADVLGF